MNDLLRRKVDNMVNIYDEMRRNYHWKVDEASLRFSAFIFSLTDTPFNVEQYNSIVRNIKDNTGMFSYYRSTLLYPMAAQLIGSFDNPSKAVQELLICDKGLKEHGFKNTIYNGIASYALLVTCGMEGIENRIVKAMEIYKLMKENHFWLTSSDDYPVAILLAGENDSVGSLVERMERHYDELHKAGFSRSNGLQFLSHLLTFDMSPVEQKVRLCVDVIDFLRSHKLKISSMYYGAIGLLALLGQDCRKALEELSEVADYMKNEGTFKLYYKELNILFISALVGNVYVEEKKKQQNLSTTSIGISVEALIAAQTAATVAAATAAASAAAAAASNSST